MTMKIGKEAREALQRAAAEFISATGAIDGHEGRFANAVSRIVRDCTDAPEVGGAEPVAWKVGVKAFVSESDALRWCESIRDATSGAQNPVAAPLYAHPPEVGLPEGWPWTSEVLERLPMTIREVSHDCGEEDWLTDPIESIARWLESAGHKEGGE